jgi:hypothetical protein
MGDARRDRDAIALPCALTIGIGMSWPHPWADPPESPHAGLLSIGLVLYRLIFLFFDP